MDLDLGASFWGFPLLKRPSLFGVPDGLRAVCRMTIRSRSINSGAVRHLGHFVIEQYVAVTVRHTFEGTLFFTAIFLVPSIYCSQMKISVEVLLTQIFRVSYYSWLHRIFFHNRRCLISRDSNTIRVRIVPVTNRKTVADI